MGERLLETRAVSKSFGGVTANKDIDFSIERGDVRCLIGPNGAGKTTFLSNISGHQRPDGGQVTYKGRDITEWSPDRVARAGIVRKFQTPTLFAGLTVAENLEIAVLGTGRQRRERQSRVKEVAARVQLQDRLDETVSTLPHGFAQWLEISLLLARDAEILLLDEPTAGMSPEETQATEALIRELSTDLSLSVVIIEHDIAFIRALRAPTTVLHLGSVIASGTMDEIEQNEEVRRIYLGEEEESAARAETYSDDEE